MINIKEKIKQHKKITILVILIILVGLFYFYKNVSSVSQPVRYVIAKVTKENIIQTIGGTGQVAALNQLTIKPLSSGQVKDVKVKAGDIVKSGDVLMTLDQKTASVSLSQARASLLSAQSDYEDLVNPTKIDSNTYESAVINAETDLDKTKIDAQNNIIEAEQTLATAEDNLKKAEGGKQSQITVDAYKNAYSTMSNAQAVFDSLLASADNILGIDNSLTASDIKPYLSILDSSKLNNASGLYLQAKEAGRQSKNIVSAVTTPNDQSSIDKALPLLENALQIEAQMLEKLYDALLATPAVGTLTQTTLDSKRSTISSARSSALSQYTTVSNQVNTLTDTASSLNTYQQTYDKAVRDLSALKINSENTIRQKEMALQTAKDNLYTKQNPDKKDVASAQAQLASASAQYQSALLNYNGCIITAPFDGQVAELDVQKGDEATTGGTVAILITNQKVAEVSLNEVDVAQIKLGQKVTLTFDAISDLNMTGKVIEIQTLGTATQGVVNYTVKIGFDADDERIKPGMSTSANIIVNMKTDTLTVPSSAIKTQGSQSYVQVANPNDLTLVSGTTNQYLLKNLPFNQSVVTGISNDSVTEITSGLQEGDTVIAQTINSTTKTTATTQQSSSIRIPGITGGGGNFRPGN